MRSFLEAAVTDVTAAQPGCCRSQVLGATAKKKKKGPSAGAARADPLHPTLVVQTLLCAVALRPGEDHVALRTTALEPLSRENLPLLLPPCVSRNS